MSINRHSSLVLRMTARSEAIVHRPKVNMVQAESDVR